VTESVQVYVDGKAYVDVKVDKGAERTVETGHGA